MRSSEVERAQHIPVRIEPERGQACEYLSAGAASVDHKEVWNVLHEDESRSNSANGALEFRPEPAVVGLSSLATGDADRLAGEAADDEIDRREGREVDMGDISELLNGWPSLREPGATPGIPLDLPERLEAGSLDTEVKAADSAEQGPERGSGHEPAQHSPQSPTR